MRAWVISALALFKMYGMPLSVCVWLMMIVLVAVIGTVVVYGRRRKDVRGVGKGIVRRVERERYCNEAVLS